MMRNNRPRGDCGFEHFAESLSFGFVCGARQWLGVSVGGQPRSDNIQIIADIRSLFATKKKVTCSIDNFQLPDRRCCV